MDLDLALKVVNNDLENFTKELKVEETPKTLLSIISGNKYFKIATKFALSAIAAGIMNTAIANEADINPSRTKSLQEAFQQVVTSKSPLFVRAKNPLNKDSDLYIYNIGSEDLHLDPISKSNLKHFLSGSRHEGQPNTLSTIKGINKINAEEYGHSEDASRMIIHDELMILGDDDFRFDNPKFNPLSKEFVFYHEVAHTSNYEGDILHAEISSDVFSTLALGKSQNMSKDELLDFTSELIKFRVTRDRDTNHQSAGGLMVLQNFISNGLNYNGMTLQEMHDLSLDISIALDKHDFASIRESIQNISTPTEDEYLSTIFTLRELLQKDTPITSDNIKSHPNSDHILKFDFVTLTSLSQIAQLKIDSSKEEFMTEYSERIKARFNLYSSPKITYKDLILDANFNNNTESLFASEDFKKVTNDIEKRINARREARSVISLLASIGEETFEKPNNEINPTERKRPKI